MKSAAVLILAFCPILFMMESFAQTKGAIKAIVGYSEMDTSTIHQTFSIGSAVEHAEKLEESLLLRKELGRLGTKSDAGNAHMLKVKKTVGLYRDDSEEPRALKPLARPIPETRIKEGVLAMQKVKSKYKEIQDSRKLEIETKKNSLSGRSFFSRWEKGFEGSISSFDPLEILLLPALGYRLENRWTIGAGPVLRGQFGNGDSKDKIPHRLSWTGYRTYSLFKFSQHIFFQAEYQRAFLSGNSKDLSEIKLDVISCGIGNEVRVGEYFRIRSAILYSINKKEIFQAESGSPWQINIGIVHFK